MSKIPLAIFATAFVVLALDALACDDGGSSPPVTVANGGQSATLLQVSGQAEGISVSGQGSATVDPDIALLDLGVSTVAGSARQARDDAAEAMTALLDSLRANAVAEDDIKTTQFTLSPEYDYSVSGRPRLTGYRLTNAVSVKLRDLDRVAEVIDEAVDAVGDPIQISGVAFTIDDPAAFESDARSQAMAAAEAKAGELAELAGVDLGEPIAISESVSGGPPIFFEAARLAAEAPSPIQPGQLQVSVSVQVTYAIK